MSLIIPTYTGQRVDLENPDPATINWTDIMVHLSHINRYFGGTKRPLSVLEHSVKLSYATAVIYNFHEDRTDLVWEALFHDAHEAYLGEMVRMVKRHPAMAYYRELEDKMDRAIREKFDLPPVMSPELKVLDMAIPRVEVASGLFLHPEGMADLCDNGTQQTACEINDAIIGFDPVSSVIWGWTPETSREKFIRVMERVAHWRETDYRRVTQDLHPA